MGRAGIVVAGLVLAFAAGVAVWLAGRAGPTGLGGGLAGGAGAADRAPGAPVTLEAAQTVAVPTTAPHGGTEARVADGPVRGAPEPPGGMSAPGPGPAAGGTVRDERGVPVPGVRVALVVQGREGGGLTASYSFVSGLDGSWWHTWAPNEPIPTQVRVTLEASDHRFRSVTPLPLEGTSGRRDLDLVVARNPCLRLRVLDAGTRVAVPDASIEPSTVEREGDTLLAWVHPEVGSLRISADGYVARQIRVSPPASGVADHPEPILMERGCALGGIVRGPTGSVLPDAVVFVELLGRAAEGVAWPVATGTTDGEGRYRLGPLLAGRYRLRVFAAGHAPGRERLDLAAEDLGHDLALVARAPGATPPDPEFAWADRRDLAVPLEVGDVPIGELIEWLEEVAGVRTRRPDAVRERLAATHVSIAVTGLPLRTAFELIASVADLVFDPEAGTWALPGRQDGGGGDGG